MKYIKKYENLNEPQDGDYIICHQNSGFAMTSINNFYSNNIGKIIEKNTDKYLIKYDTIPEKLKSFFNDLKNCRIVLRHEIIKKYNL